MTVQESMEVPSALNVYGAVVWVSGLAVIQADRAWCEEMKSQLLALGHGASDYLYAMWNANAG